MWKSKCKINHLLHHSFEVMYKQMQRFLQTQREPIIRAYLVWICVAVDISYFILTGFVCWKPQPILKQYSISPSADKIIFNCETILFFLFRLSSVQNRFAKTTLKSKKENSLSTSRTMARPVHTKCLSKREMFGDQTPSNSPRRNLKTQLFFYGSV